MSRSRLEVALEDQGEHLIPPQGRIAVYGAPAAAVTLFPPERTVFVTRRRTDFDRVVAAGLDAVPELEGRVVAGFVFLPRAKAEARDTIARFASQTDGALVVDGQKTDGIDSLIKAMRSGATIESVVAKAHGKLVVLTDATFPEWVGAPHDIGGFVTRPGVFSADGADPGSVLLADTLPGDLKGAVADLGAGWGYLSRAVLERPDVTSLDLIEADSVALDCARENVLDKRASFHWADATRWRPDHAYDVVVMNPPFHTGRAAEADLGVAFIETAARTLRRSGVLWMVANRHLAYERPLSERFARVDEVGGDRSYKIFRAERPARR